MGDFKTVLDLLRGALSFVIVIPILVAAHELGHFWVARLFGMHVEAFAVMIGGLRKTPLEPGLAKPLLSSRIVWAIGAVLGVGLTVAFGMQSLATTTALLVALGIVMPVWIITRIGALYRLPLASTLKTLFITWALAFMMSVFASQGRGMPPVKFIGLLAISSLVAVLVVYYHPVLHKSEDAPQGEGVVTTETGPMTVLFRPLLSKRDRHGTEFSLLCLPLGGFALIKGMTPKEDGSETKIEGGFYSEPPFARFCALLAGPAFSVLFGVLVLTGLFWISGEKVASNSVEIGSVSPNAPAAKAGIKAGDSIVAVNGESVATFYDAVRRIRASHETVDGKEVAKPVELRVRRDGSNVSFLVVPVVDQAPSPVFGPDMKLSGELAVQSKIGMSPQLVTTPLPIGAAFYRAAITPVDMVMGLVNMVRKPSTIAENVGGPVAVAETMTAASQQGPDQVVLLAGLLSITLGIMNLLPFYPLDGGQIVVSLIEMLRGGRRISMRVQSVVTTVGVLLIIMMMLSIWTIDIGRHVNK